MSPEKSLAEILAERMRVREPIPVPATLAILRQVCDALEYAHNLRDPEGRPLGIVHRDLSPAHIFVAETGIVRVVASSAPQGAYAYMAPEFVTSGMLDARADLFALGVVAHEMLANQPLFASGDDRETLNRVVGLSIPPPSSINAYVPPDLDGIVLTALARDPAYRWQHAAMMRDNIAAVAHRLGLDAAAAQGALWVDLLTARVDAPPPPQPPPSAPELWNDDTGLETRIEPLDPRMLELANAANAAADEPVALGSYQAAPAPAAPVPGPQVALGSYERPSRPAPVVVPRDASLVPYETAPSAAQDVPPPQVDLGRYEAAPQDLPPTIHSQPMTSDPAPPPVVSRTMTPRPRPSRPAPARAPTPAPVAPEPMAYAPEPMAYTPEPMAPPPAEPELPPQTPRPMFEPELGPEPTQIGAMPLISFGNTPLVSLVGEDPRRASSASLPPPASVGTFVPAAAPAPAPRDKKRLVMIGAIGVVVAIVLIVVVLLAT